MNFLLIAVFAVAGPGDSPLLREAPSAAARGEVFQVGGGCLHEQPGRAGGRSCGRPGGVIWYLWWEPPAYYLPCSGGCCAQPYCCADGPGYGGYCQPRYDYRRSFDYPWNMGSGRWTGTW